MYVTPPCNEDLFADNFTWWEPPGFGRGYYRVDRRNYRLDPLLIIEDVEAWGWGGTPGPVTPLGRPNKQGRTHCYAYRYDKDGITVWGFGINFCEARFKAAKRTCLQHFIELYRAGHEELIPCKWWTIVKSRLAGNTGMTMVTHHDQADLTRPRVRRRTQREQRRQQHLEARMIPMESE